MAFFRTRSTQFSSDIKNWVEGAKRKRDAAYRGTLRKMCSRVIMRTPVKEGIARGNWKAVRGSVSGVSFDPKARDKGPVTQDGSGSSSAKAQMRSVVSGLTMKEKFTLTNKAPHIRRLEYGWSAQAPAGMVRITLQEFQAQADAAAREAREGGSDGAD